MVSFRVRFPLMLVLAVAMAQLSVSTVKAEGLRATPMDGSVVGIEESDRMLHQAQEEQGDNNRILATSTKKYSGSTYTKKSTTSGTTTTTKPSTGGTSSSTTYKKPPTSGTSSGSTKTTSEHVTIWTKLKESLGMSIVGLILICFMPILLWRNEGRHVTELKKITYCKNNAVAIDCDSPSEDDVGRLVHFVGSVNVGDSELDFSSGGTTYGSDGGGLNLTGPLPNALVVRRKCSIYQKFETSEQETKKDMIGGGETRTTTYGVREDWTNMPQPEQLENLPEETNSRGIWEGLVGAAVGVTGGGSAEAPQGLAVTTAARVGDFGLAQDDIIDEPFVFMSEWEPVPNDMIPDSVDGCEGLEKGSDNVLRTFPEGEEPQNGDVMVEYEYVPDQFKCSFVVRQGPKADPESGASYAVEKCDVITDQCFGQCTDDLGTIWMIRKGIHDLEEMIELAVAEENACTKIMRFLGWALLMAGWCFLFSPFTTALQVLPLLTYVGGAAVVIAGLIVSCVCACTVITAAYVRYRPLLAVGLLALAGGIWGIVIWRLNVASKEVE